MSNNWDEIRDAFMAGAAEVHRLRQENAALRPELEAAKAELLKRDAIWLPDKDAEIETLLATIRDNEAYFMEQKNAYAILYANAQMERKERERLRDEIVNRDAVIATQANMIERANSELEAAKAELAQAREANRWIPIAEGLPNNGEIVYCVNGNRICPTRYTEGTRFSPDMESTFLAVTHWRYKSPLPGQEP